MNALFQAGKEFQDFFKKRKWSFCFIGALAVIRWGEPRMTQDIDISLLPGFNNESTYINELLKNYRSRIKDPVNFALKNRVLLLTAHCGTDVDISLSALPFEKRMIKKSSSFLFAPNCSLITCSADDLIILKAFANREKDWPDIESIIFRQGKSLNPKYILRTLKPLCALKESPEIVKKLKKYFIR